MVICGYPAICEKSLQQLRCGLYWDLNPGSFDTNTSPPREKRLKEASSAKAPNGLCAPGIDELKVSTVWHGIQ